MRHEVLRVSELTATLESPHVGFDGGRAALRQTTIECPRDGVGRDIEQAGEEPDGDGVACEKRPRLLLGDAPNGDGDRGSDRRSVGVEELGGLLAHLGVVLDDERPRGQAELGGETRIALPGEHDEDVGRLGLRTDLVLADLEPDGALTAADLRPEGLCQVTVQSVVCSSAREGVASGNDAVATTSHDEECQLSGTCLGHFGPHQSPPHA